jgi:hypothetical protein
MFFHLKQCLFPSFHSYAFFAASRKKINWSGVNRLSDVPGSKGRTLLNFVYFGFCFAIFFLYRIFSPRDKDLLIAFVY